MILAIQDILEAHVTDNWELTVKIFTLKWGKDKERAKSSEAIK